MKKISILLLFIASFCYGQDIIMVGHFNAHRGDSTGVNRNSLAKAQLDTDKLAKTNFNGDDMWITTPYYRYEAPLPEPNIGQEPLVDTVILNRRVDVDGNPINGVIDKVLGFNHFLFVDNGMVSFKSDTINSMNVMYEFKRTKDYGETRYDLLSIPFHFQKVDIYEITSTTTEIYIYLSRDVEYLSLTYGEVGTRESMSITSIDNKIIGISPLRSNTEYQFQMLAKDLEGNQISSALYNFKTL